MQNILIVLLFKENKLFYNLTHHLYFYLDILMIMNINTISYGHLEISFGFHIDQMVKLIVVMQDGDV